LRSTRDRYLIAGAHAVQGEFQLALPLLQEATQRDPQDYWAWFVRGICHFGLAQEAEAATCYTACIVLWPKSHWAHFNRGVISLYQQNYGEARADFDRVIQLQPDRPEAYLNRALARQGLGQYGSAVDDLTRALDLGASPTRAYFMRARARELAGDAQGAQRDRAEGMRFKPTDEKGWLARGVAQLSTDPEAALADFTQALNCNRRSRAALQNQAHVLAEKLGRPQEALAVLDRVIRLYPDYVRARAGRGVVLARLKKRSAALQDAEEALSRDQKPPTFYQVAGIYALTSAQDSQDKPMALQLLSIALRNGYGLHLLKTDREWDGLRDDRDFRRLVEAAQARAASETRSTAKR
jgi:tetratricopeptide (TPR) repeat protein